MADDPFKKARDADRDAATEVVEAAYADGQITQPDYELRVERMLQARTVGELQSLIRDLQVTEPVPQPPSGRAEPSEPRGFEARFARTSTSGQPTRIAGVLAAFVAVVLAMGFAGVLAVVGEEGSSSGTSVFEQEAQPRIPDLTKHQGWDRFVAAVEEKTGSTVVWSATVYQGYAVIEVPVDERSQRSFGWYWNGDWRKWTGKGTQPDVFERVDLGQIRGDVVAEVVAKARRRVDDPTTSYVVVRGTTMGEPSCFSAYASNDVSESSHLDATCDGRVVGFP